MLKGLRFSTVLVAMIASLGCGGGTPADPMDSGVQQVDSGPPVPVDAYTPAPDAWTATCFGTPMSCSSVDVALCSTIQGCNVTSCRGFAIACDRRTHEECTRTAAGGCTWTGTACTGTATPCGNLTSDEDCQAQAGCAVSGGGPTCSGTATSCGAFTEATCASQPGCTTDRIPPIRRQMIGNPVWDIVGCQRIPAAIPDLDSYIALVEVFYPGHIYESAESATPHPPPYDMEHIDAIRTAGYSDTDRLTVSQWSVTNGMILACVLVPTDAAPMGSSIDFASGPIIPQALLPIDGSGIEVRRNGALFDGDFNAVVQIESKYDGASHFVLDFADSFAFAPAEVTDPRGDYDWHLVMVDQDGNGWDITIPFIVE